MNSPTENAATPPSSAPTPSRPFWRRSWVVIAGVTTVLVLGGAVAGAGIVDDDGTSETAEQEASEDVANAPTGSISAERAGELAVEAAGGGTVTDLDLDEAGGATVFEVEVQRVAGDESSEAEVLVDAQTGDIVSLTDDPVDDDEEGTAAEAAEGDDG